jgi:hypothetical protein
MFIRTILTGLCSLLGTWIGWYFRHPFLGAGIGFGIGAFFSILCSPLGPEFAADCLDSLADACFIADWDCGDCDCDLPDCDCDLSD